MKIKCKKCGSKSIGSKFIPKDTEVNTKYSYRKPTEDICELVFCFTDDEPSYYFLGLYTYIDLLEKRCNICDYKWFELTNDQAKSKKEILAEIEDINKESEKKLVELNSKYKACHERPKVIITEEETKDKSLYSKIANWIKGK